MSSATSKKPTVVVAGLGIAGAKVAQKLAATGTFDVISIDPKEYIEVPFSRVRTAVTADRDDVYLNKTLIPYTAMGNLGSRTIRAAVTAVKRNSVELDSNESVTFDYAVLAMGATYNGAGVIATSLKTVAERREELKAASQKIRDAKSIAVVGGGATGIELVGEIVEAYAGKAVSLITSAPQLLDGKDARMHDAGMAALKRAGVKVVLGDKAANHDESAGVLHTAKGEKIPAELVLWAAGSKANSAALVAGGELAGAVDARGLAKVDEFLRLEGAPHIFVLGDMNNTPHGKMGFLADLQAELTVKNLPLVAAGGSSPKLAKWSPPMQPKGAMMVTFGSRDGFGHFGGCFCGSWLIKRIKGGDLFVGQFRKGFGVKP